MKDQQTKDKFVEMRAKGISYDRIANKLNVHRQTLIKWSKDLNIEIANLKSIELESLFEKHHMAKEKRIEIFAKKLKDIEAELDKRKLSELTTRELQSLFMKYDSILQKEKTATIFKEEKDTILPFDFDKTTTETWEA